MAMSEIDKLERRYAENPHGLTFAPLAEVYRKNGDVPRALALLETGLQQHPEYIPAHIVFGRCHLDGGDLGPAEQAFSHVLTLDGENAIALKALADISERQSRYDDAERWLGQLLTIDRSNEAAQEQLARVTAARQVVQLGSTVVPSAEPDLAPEPAVVDEAVHPNPVDTIEPPVEVASVTEPELMAVDDPAALQGWDAEPSSLADDAAIETAPLTLDDDLTPPPSGVLPTEGLVPEEASHPASLGPVDTLADLMRPDMGKLRDEIELERAGGDDFQIETESELDLRAAASSEFQMPDASQDLIPATTESDPLMPSRSALEQGLMAEAAATASRADSEAEADDNTDYASDDVQDDAVAGLIVTETMAELLVQQGHTDDALRIYRALERRTGGDARIRDKRLALEAATAPSTAPVQAYAASETGGQSVQDFFQQLLAARPAAAPAPAPKPAAPSSDGAAPTRPAADALSLRAVFGDETSAVAPAGTADTLAGADGKPNVSFDEFFGANRPKAAPSAPDAKDDDLDQFQSWLQNLKR